MMTGAGKLEFLHLPDGFVRGDAGMVHRPEFDGLVMVHGAVCAFREVDFPGA